MQHGGGSAAKPESTCAFSSAASSQSKRHNASIRRECCSLSEFIKNKLITKERFLSLTSLVIANLYTGAQPRGGISTTPEDFKTLHSIFDICRNFKE